MEGKLGLGWRPLATVALIGGMGLAVAGCDTLPPLPTTPTSAAAVGEPPSLQPTPLVEPTTEIALPRDAWSTLSAIDRLRMLQVKQSPLGEGFNATQELVKATAEYFASRIPSNKSKEVIAQSVLFVTGEELVKGIEEDIGRLLTSQERAGYLENYEVTTEKGRIFINSDKIDKVVAGNPEDQVQLGNEDLKTVMVKSILFHAFAHLTKTTEKIQVEPFPMKIPFSELEYTITGMDGFDVIARDATGRAVKFRGEEARAEHIARTLSFETGRHITIISSYRRGVEQLAAVNKVAGLSFDAFAPYAVGTKPLGDYLDILGRVKGGVPDRNASLRALALAGYVVGGTSLPIQAADELSR